MGVRDVCGTNRGASTNSSPVYSGKLGRDCSMGVTVLAYSPMTDTYVCLYVYTAARAVSLQGRPHGPNRVHLSPSRTANISDG